MKDFLQTNHFCPETLWLTPQGVLRWGHATACTTRCPWKTSNYFQHFRASKTRTPSWRRSRGRFLHKGHPTGSLPSLSKTGMLTQRGTAQALVPLCIPGTGETQHSGMGSRHNCSSWCNKSLPGNTGSFASEVVTAWIQSFLPSSVHWLVRGSPLAFLHLSCGLYNYIFLFSNSLKQYLTYPIPSQMNQHICFQDFPEVD